MPVSKTLDVELRKAGFHHYSACREVADLITNPIAFTIWHYLLSQSDGWIIRREDIRRRFGIGKEGYAKAMKHLKELGLILEFHVRDEGGRIVSNTTVCYDMPQDMAEANAKELANRSPANRTPGLPDAGLPDSRFTGQPESRTLNNRSKDLNNRSSINNRSSTKDTCTASAAPVGYSDEFEEFWRTWPKGYGAKGSKKNAYREWQAQSSYRPDNFTLINRVLRQADGKRSSGSRVSFKHVERWLKGHEWENEIEEKSNATYQQPTRETPAQRCQRKIDERAAARTAAEGDGSVVAAYAGGVWAPVG